MWNHAPAEFNPPRWLVLVALVLSLTLLRSVSNNIRHARNARQLRTRDPPLRVNRLPLGFDFLRRLLRATAEGRIAEEMVSVYKETGAKTLKLHVLGRTQFYTMEPKNIQAMLATQFSDFSLGKSREISLRPMLGRGIFTANGPYWEHSRAMLRPQFARQQIADLESEEKHVQHLLLTIQPDRLTGWAGPLDLSVLFFRLTIDSATEFLFGQSVLSQIQDIPNHALDKSELLSKGDWRAFGKHFDRGTYALGIRIRMAGLTWLHFSRTFKEDCREIHRFADYFVSLALQRAEERENQSATVEEGKRYVFLDELIKETRDPLELRCQLLHILLAGRDTTAGLLGWAFFELARHPDVYEKLRRTILETFGPYESPRDITFERLKGCTYLQYVLNETLRLWPPVPINSRMAVRDTTLPVGGGPDGKSPIYVRKGEEILYHVFGVHRREDIWGPDASEWRPDRWYGYKPGWEYLPFNGGPRICLGQQFALTQAGYVITRLVQKFDKIVPADPTEKAVHQFGVTSSPRTVLVRLHDSTA